MSLVYIIHYKAQTSSAWMDMKMRPFGAERFSDTLPTHIQLSNLRKKSVFGDVWSVDCYPCNVQYHIRKGTDLWQCTLMGTLMYCFTWKYGRWHHDLISHSVTLSSLWANQSLSYPNNTQWQASKRQVSILEVFGLTPLGTEPNSQSFAREPTLYWIEQLSQCNGIGQIQVNQQALQHNSVLGSDIPTFAYIVMLCLKWLWWIYWMINWNSTHFLCNLFFIRCK